jgi:hypothetical protein
MNGFQVNYTFGGQKPGWGFSKYWMIVKLNLFKIYGYQSLDYRSIKLKYFKIINWFCSIHPIIFWLNLIFYNKIAKSLHLCKLAFSSFIAFPASSKGGALAMTPYCYCNELLCIFKCSQLFFSNSQWSWP